MKKILKNIKGFSLSEVLVAIGIVTILSVYGVSFFEAAWKYRSENDDYLTVLNNVASNLESVKYSMVSNETTRIFNNNGTLGGDNTVEYTVTLGVPEFGGAIPITSSAVVRSANNTKYTITLKSYVFGNFAETI